MLIKVLLTAAAATAISSAAYAQQQDNYRTNQDPTRATSPNTVNPPASTWSSTPAPTGVATDVVAINGDEARARGIPVETITNGPVPDTPENRARYGQPMSNAGKNTAPRAN